MRTVKEPDPWWRMLDQEGRTSSCGRHEFIGDVTDEDREEPLSMSALGEFVFRTDTAMYVVTAKVGSVRAGCLVGFACQVSIQPERFLVAVSAANHTHRIAAAANVLALHLLPSSSVELASLFGESTGDTTDKFAQCSFHDGPGDVPILDDAIAVLVGRVLDRIDFGDHTGHLLEPISTTMAGSHAPPYSLQQARGLKPGHPTR